MHACFTLSILRRGISIDVRKDCVDVCLHNCSHSALLGREYVNGEESVGLAGFLQVKPAYLDSVMDSLRPHITERHLIISIVAGVKLAGLESGLPEGARVVNPLPLGCSCCSSFFAALATGGKYHLLKEFVEGLARSFCNSP